MTAYLDRSAFKARSIMPATDVDDLESIAAGWVDMQLEQVSRWIDSRLRKRYDAPFDVATCPEIVKSWLTRLVTLRAYLRRGVDATDAQFEMIKADAEAAAVEIKEAADSADGLFDLPLKDSSKATGVSQGGPFVYSEASPYDFIDVQREAVRDGQ
jgi:phage gp36-like protein